MADVVTAGATDIQTVPRHPNRTVRVSPWIDEAMWGHRLWDSQSPWLVFLEFMTVAEACAREGHLLSRSEFPLHYRPAKRMHLRNILFNNGALERIVRENTGSGAAWDAWLRWMDENALGVQSADFSYLRPRFHKFEHFSRLVGMLQGSMVEGESNRRWTSQFVFPYGPNGLYEDLAYNAKTLGLNREYINFGRSGEILYLMLARSSRREELAEALRPFLEERGEARDRLLALLQPGPEEPTDARGASYLPRELHPSYDALAEDWMAILRMGLPGFDAFPHLVTLGAYHLMLYQLSIAAEWTARGRGAHMVCEVVAPKKTLIREISVGNYIENNSMSALAIERFIDGIAESEDWQRAAQSPGAYDACREILKERVWWGDDYQGLHEPDAMLSDLRAGALKRHKQHAGNVHRSYGRDIGLISRRGTNRMRYAPSDSFLKTVLFANVPRRMELGEFLERLFERYGLVIGEREANRVLDPDDYDQKAFQANARRLEQRLSSLGLLRRLSDGCAYVLNPLGGDR